MFNIDDLKNKTVERAQWVFNNFNRPTGFAIDFTDGSSILIESKNMREDLQLDFFPYSNKLLIT